MKSILRRRLVQGISLLLLGTGLFAGTGKAQSVGRGQFTLPVEARWGSVVLQPGIYTYSNISESSPSLISLEKQPGNLPIAMVMAQSESVDSLSNRDWLTLERVDGEFVVTAMHLQTYGIALSYPTHSAKKKLLAQGRGTDILAPRSGQALPMRQTTVALAPGSGH